MPLNYLHGAEVLNIDDGPRAIQTVNSAVVGIVGTAPDADGEVFPLNTPVLIPGSWSKLAKLGVKGTLPLAISRIYRYAGAAVVVIRVEEKASLPEQLSAIIGSDSLYKGVYGLLRAQSTLGFKPKLLLAPGFTSQRPTGVAQITVSNAGQGYGTAPEVVFSGGGGQGAKASALIDNGQVKSVQIVSGGFGYTSAPVLSFEGGGGEGATATATIASLANPVTLALNDIAAKLRAMVYADTSFESNEAAFLWRNDFSSRRIYPWTPLVKIWNSELSAYTDEYVSPSIVGAQVKLDHEKGFWWSPSNQELIDVGGLSRPIEFRMGDYSAEANLLNSQHLNTVINYDGWRSWGNRTCETDANWVFASSVRIADQVDESILAASRPWVDQPMLKPALITDIIESTNAYLRLLKREGAIVGGKAWIEAEKNSNAELSLGNLRIEFDREPTAPLEHLIYGAHRNQTYYSLAMQDVMAEVQRAQAYSL